MKKIFKRILALTLSTIMVSGSISAMASTYTNDFFDSKTDAYGTNIEYIEDQLEDIDEKINDTLAHHFLSSPYRDLLRLFYYLKYQTVSLTDMLAKVTGASLDVSKNPNNKDKKKK